MTCISSGEPAESDWRDQAACVGEDPEIFFPLADLTAPGAEASLARAICRRCPVIIDCRTWALAHGEDDGIWGATTAAQRRAIRRATSEPSPATRHHNDETGRTTELRQRCRAPTPTHAPPLPLSRLPPRAVPGEPGKTGRVAYSRSRVPVRGGGQRTTCRAKHGGLPGSSPARDDPRERQRPAGAARYKTAATAVAARHTCSASMLAAGPGWPGRRPPLPSSRLLRPRCPPSHPGAGDGLAVSDHAHRP
ncbi:WhiB family transcriptional regulator [Streptomyces sp. NPDC088810]|uniref:WhiB family transcriptional regulator n=1 Tax=Streptomyces sp. NPDC088810 TaxID=3365904 RepID=UPI0038091A25